MILKRHFCPRCGSKNITTIFSGLGFTKNAFERTVDQQAVVVKDSIVTNNNATYHCHQCKQRFGGPTMAQERKTTSIYFQLRDYSGKSYIVTVTKNIRGALINYEKPTGTIYQLDISRNRWKQIIKSLFHCYIIDWKEKYIGREALHITHWTIKITMNDGSIMKRSGRNAYPPYWWKLKRLINSLLPSEIA